MPSWPSAEFVSGRSESGWVEFRHLMLDIANPRITFPEHIRETLQWRRFGPHLLQASKKQPGGNTDPRSRGDGSQNNTQFSVSTPQRS